MSLGKLKKALEYFDCIGNPIDKESVAIHTGDSDEVRMEANNSTERINRSIDYDDQSTTTDVNESSEAILRIPVPLSMMALYRFIKDEQLGAQVVWGRMLMQFIFDIGNSQEEPGKLTFGFKSHKIYLGTDSEEVLKKKPRLLCVHVVQHSAELMPIDTIFSLKMLPEEQAQQQPDTPSTSKNNAPVYTSGATVIPRGTQEFTERNPPPVFGNVMVYEDPLRRVQFSSIEAVHFNSEDLWRVTQSVDQNDAHHIARLFCLHNHQRLTVVACARHGLKRHCFFLVPLKYMFTSLLQRVHDYLAIRQLLGDYINLPPLLTLPDQSLYRLPVTTDAVVFDCDSLYRVVQFIETHLINAHPLFVPAEISAHLRPFVCERTNAHVNENTWPAVWQNRARMAEANRAAGHAEEANYLETNLQCSVACVVYYVTLPPQHNQAAARINGSPSRPRRRPPMPSKQRTDLTTDDERNGSDRLDDSSTLTDANSPSTKTTNSSPIIQAQRRKTDDRTPTTPPDHTLQSNPKQAPAQNNNDDDDDEDGDGGYDFTFGKYLPDGTPRPGYKPEPLPKSTSPINQMLADGPGSQRTPRTEPISDMNLSGNLNIKSVTTKSHDGSDSSDNDDDDDDEDDATQDDYESAGNNRDDSSVFTPAPVPQFGAFGTPIPLSNTPYAPMPIFHRSRSPPPPPLPLADNRKVTALSSSHTSAAGSGSEQTMFHLSASEEKY